MGFFSSSIPVLLLRDQYIASCHLTLPPHLCLLICATSSFSCGATLPPQVSSGSARIFFKWLNMNWSLYSSSFCRNLYPVDSQTIYSNRIECKWGNALLYLQNSAQRQICWTQSFNFIFGAQHNFLKILLLKSLRLWNCITTKQQELFHRKMLPINIQADINKRQPLSFAVGSFACCS